MKIMSLLPSTLTLADTSCPPIELTVGNVIGKTVDVPYIGQFCQYVGIPYAEPPERWLPSVRLQRKPSNKNSINSIEKRPPCPDVGRENFSESCLYFDIYKPIGLSPIPSVTPFIVLHKVTFKAPRSIPGHFRDY